MRRTLCSLVLAAVAAALLPASSASVEPARVSTGESPAFPTDALPEPVPGGVVVDLAGGDRFEVTVSSDQRSVVGRRYDAASGSWGGRQAVLRRPHLFCGQVDARAAGRAVAVTASCDTGGYSEDGEHTSSYALYSPDASSWQSMVLPSWWDEEPGISPSGNAAIWPVHDGWLTWTAAGFTHVRHDLPGQEYSVTATIADTGDVSVLYGGVHDQSGQCADVLRVLNVSSSGVETTQDLPVDHGCSDVALANTGATTAVFGELAYPQSVIALSRADTTAAWAVTATAPQRAPGLRRHGRRAVARTVYAQSRGLPLLAVGSTDGRTFEVQSYDVATRTWAPPRTIGRRLPGCGWGDANLAEPHGVVAFRVDCGERRRLLVSGDSVRWYDVDLGRRPLGVSPDGRLVSVSDKVRTLVFSRERGRVRLPSAVRHRCDVVQPVAPDAAVRLTARRSTGYPERLDLSSASGWRPSRTRFPHLRGRVDDCRYAQAEYGERPTTYWFQGRRRGIALVLGRRGDGSWKVRRTGP